MPYQPTYPGMLQNPANPAYNPNMPGPDWAGFVAAIYKGLQETKDRKRGESQQAEDMKWKQLQRELATRESELGIESGKLKIEEQKRTAKEHVPPNIERFLKGIETAGKQEHEKKMVGIRGEEDRKTLKDRFAYEDKTNKERIKKNAAMSAAYRKERSDIEKKHTENIAQIDRQHKAEVSRVRGDKNINQPGASATATPYLVAMRGSLQNKKRSTAELEARKKQQLEELDELYGRFLSGEDDFDVYSTSKPKTAAGQATIPDGAPTATHPQTGEKIVKINGKWVKDPRF